MPRAGERAEDIYLDCYYENNDRDDDLHYTKKAATS